MDIVLTVLLAAILAAITYLGFERLGRRAWVPLACRAVAWAALGLLLVNVSCAVTGARGRPLVLLDGSLSLTASGGQWAAARDSAAQWGTVRLFGDERSGADTGVKRGRSLLQPALAAAAASGRPVVIVTDGEVEDAADLSSDLLARSEVRIFPREVAPDIAVTRVDGPERIAEGDSLRLDIAVRAVGDTAPDSVTVEVSTGTESLGRRTAALAGGLARLTVPVRTSGLAAGDHLLRAAIVGHDREPRTDARLHRLTVTATPGVVLLAAPGDWDSRFLYRTLKDVAQLPVRGYVQLRSGRWRSMDDLAATSDAQVRRAARGADLLVLKGGSGDLASGATARGVWRWPSGESGEAPIAGDWYLGASGASPMAGAFVGAPVDSFPPAMRLTPIEPEAGDWIALEARESRRGAARPAVVGGERGDTRMVAVAVDGLWRWAFRGGSSEQAYRAWVAATVSWLLGGADSARGRARPVRPVVANSRPIVFEWLGPGAAAAVPIAWARDDTSFADTLRFDGSGHARAWLPVGEYRYRLGGGGTGLVAVEPYSEELLPRPVVLRERASRLPPAMEQTAAREWLWLFGICIAGFSGEWLARRRLGLR